MRHIIKRIKTDFSYKSIIKLIIILFTICAVVLIGLKDTIFEPDSLLANLFEEEVSNKTSVRCIKTVLALFACYSVNAIVKFFVNYILMENSKARTVGNLLSSVCKYGVVLVGIIFILSAWGVDTDTLIASAGIVSLIIGLGCQSLISDIVAGLFILFEGDFKVGDVVVIGGWRGTVLAIGLRTTKIIDAAGNVKIINNSNISDIVNNTKELSLAVCTCGIEYGESIERVENVIENNLDLMKKRIPAIINGPFYKGVEELGDSAVVIKLIANCKEEDKYQVQRDMNRELKIIFDKNNINIPFPQVVINKPVEFTNQEKVNAKQAKNFVDEQKEASKALEEVNQ